MSLLSRIVRALCGGKYLVIGEHPSSQALHPLPAPSQSEVRSPPTSHSNGISPSQRYVQVAQDLRSSLPSTCRWLGPEDVEIVGEHPVGAGGFAGIWEGTHSGHKVVLKSYRCYMSFDAAQVVARFCNEVYVCNLLRHRDADTVPFVGVYSTEEHPFGLVYEHMANFDLRQYLKNEPNVGRLDLLLAIAKCLRYMHGMNVVHGQLKTTNILVDNNGTARIAGLGNASIPSYPTGRTVDGRTSVGRASRNIAPEDAHGSSFPTKAGDMYAFGVVAWEVLTGRPPFFEMTEIAATYSMLNGARPSRQNHHEISDRIWYMVERCWCTKPSKRMSVEGVVELLEAELRRAADSGT